MGVCLVFGGGKTREEGLSGCHSVCRGGEGGGGERGQQEGKGGPGPEIGGKSRPFSVDAPGRRGLSGRPGRGGVRGSGHARGWRWRGGGGARRRGGLQRGAPGARGGGGPAPGRPPALRARAPQLTPRQAP